MCRLVSLICVGLLFSVSIPSSADEKPAEKPAAAAEVNPQILKSIENSLGRQRVGQVVYALLEMRGTDGRGSILVTVKVTETREAAAREVYDFMAQGSPQSPRTFQYLKSFPANQAEKAEEFRAAQQTAMEKQIEVQSQQAKAFAEYQKRMQEQFRKMQGAGGFGGGFGRPR